MHGGVPDPAAFRRVLAAEECFAAVQPRKWIFLAVERGKLEVDARVEVGVDVVILLAEAIPRRRPKRGFRAWQWLERGVGARRQLGTMVPLVVDGVVRGVDVLLGGRLAVALGRLDADESEV